MKDLRDGQLFEAFIKSAQYFVGLKTQQDVWEHLGKFVVTYLPAQWSAFAERDATGGISIHHCRPAVSDGTMGALTEQVRGLVADVLESGFLASQVIENVEPSMTAFIPIVEEHRPKRIMLVGHRGTDPLSRELLNVYLAVAGLAGTTFERLQHDRELHRYRTDLELLVRERTSALAAAQRHNELLLHSVGEGICGIDPDGRITFANPSAVRLLGWEASELIGRDAHATFHHTRDDGDPYPKEECLLHAALRDGSVSGQTNEQFWRKDGSRFPVEFAVTPIMEDGRVVGAVLVFRDFSAQKAAEEAIHRAKANAEAANQAKDQFIATLSHELRTPLTPALAAASSMLEDHRLPQDLREDVELIHRNVGLEVALIGDLLDVTRIATGKLVLDRRPVDVSQIVRDAARISSVDSSGRSQIFSIETPGEPYPLLGDAVRLHQVFWNLISNAVKFTPQGGRISIRCRREQHSVTIEVSDTGMGIAPEVIPKLFSRFEQGDGTTTRQFGGLGLGLSIAKAVVEMHGGQISAHSEGRSKGATFVVRLPIHDCQVPARRTENDSPHRHSEVHHRRLSILLVEDHTDTAKLMSRLLRAKGHAVVGADCVKTALETVQQNQFDLIISDLGLPDGSGHDLMRQLTAIGKRVPAIALSGYGTVADIEKSRQAGFTEHLVKPVELAALQSALLRVTREQVAKAQT